MKITAKAHFDYLNDGDVRMTLEGVKLLKVVDKVLYNDRLETEMNEEVELEDISAKLRKCLELPIKFRFKLYAIEREIVTEKGVREYCLNVQRAIANQFYLPIKGNNEKYQVRENEVTVIGKCTVGYAIIFEKPYYQVKRIIDLFTCTEQPMVLKFSTPNTDAFYRRRMGNGTAKELPNFSRRAVYMHYDLDGDLKTGFIIRNVVSENVEDLTLNGDAYQAGKAVAAHSRQQLTLCAKNQPIPSTAKVIKNEQKRGGLLFVFDKNTTEIKSSSGQANTLREVRKHIANIKQHLQGGDILAQTAEEFTRLVSVLRHCTVETLRKCVTEDVMTCAKLDVKRLLLDAIAHVGTEAAGIVLKECVAGGKVNKELGRIVFGIGWVRAINAAYMKQVLAICEQQNVAANASIHRSCWLSFGTLVNRLMWNMRKNRRMSQDLRLVTFRQYISKTIKQNVENAKDFEEKITYLKTIGNAGWITEDIFKVVCGFLEEIKTPLHVQQQAIWALRHMARVRPLLVRQKLFPIFANPVKDPESRMSCYKVLILGNPSLITCEMIAAVIGREAWGQGPRSNQLVSFVVSDLRTSIYYDNIDRVRASRARLILRFIPRATAFQALSYSKSVNVPIDEGSNMGWELRLSKISAPQTFLPRHLHAKTVAYMPGISADFVEFGARLQGVHDMLMPFLGPNENRQKRSLEILKYIFGTTTNEKNEEGETIGYKKNLPARVATYMKIFGSEIGYSKFDETDLRKVIEDALFGEKTSSMGGCSFSAQDIKCQYPFTRGHMISEKRYMVPTLLGIPLKYSSKTAVVAKGYMAANLTGIPKLITSKFEQIKAKVTFKPKLSVHVHNKVGVWLPIFESGVILKHQLLSKPKINFDLSVNQQGFHLEAPIAAPDQKLLVLKPDLQAVMRKELEAGNREWLNNIDLQLTKRGFIDVPQTCYGKDYLTLTLCKQGRIVDPEYLRLKRVPAFPYYWLNQWDFRLKNDEVNTPTKFMANYEITTNTDAIYVGEGTLQVVGKSLTTMATMKPHCNKKKWTCKVDITYLHKRCRPQCKAKVDIDYSQEDRLAINTKYGNKEMNNEIRVEDEGRTMRIINTWDKLPEWLKRKVRLHHSATIAFFHRFFGVKDVESKENHCEVTVKLLNKFVADFYVNTSKLQLRRINQELPFAINNFYFKNRFETIKRFYGACSVKGTNRIETTDNVIINEEIPSTCPFVLAEDQRSDAPQWRILFRKAEGERQNLIFELDKDKIEFKQDKSVKVNGKKIELKTGINEFKWGKVGLVDNQLYFYANCGVMCLFDGSKTTVLFSPWYHDRIRGICGNNDGERWTDFITRRNTFLPERMTKEFLREWVVEGTGCKDKQCKLKAKHMNTTIGAPQGKVCFTIGRFLRCMAKCSPLKKQRFEKVPYHCVSTSDELYKRIMAGDPTVSLETRCVDLLAPVEEHRACQCDCQ